MEEIVRKSFPLYNLKEKLGGGQFGEVYLIEDEFKKWAVKVVPMEQERSANYRTSDAMAEKLDRDFKAVKDFYYLIEGEGVLYVHDFHVTKKETTKRNAKSHLLVVMKYYPDNLLDYVFDHPAIPPKKAEEMILDLATVLHRLTTLADDTFLVTDLKPSNILMDEDEKLLIGDLGGIKKMGSVASRSRGQMTIDWSAPETVFKYQKPGVPSLIFSFGLVAYFILESKRPYENKEEDILERFRMMEAGGIHFERTDLPKRITETVINCLGYEPGDRPLDFATVLELLDKEIKEERNIFEDKSLDDGETPVEMTGTLEIISDPEGAEWYLDGEYAGVTPEVKRNIKAGTHQVTIKKEGYKEAGETVVIEAGKTKTVSKKLEKIKKEKNKKKFFLAAGTFSLIVLVSVFIMTMPRKGSIWVKSSPPGAEISINGVVMGSAEILL